MYNQDQRFMSTIIAPPVNQILEIIWNHEVCGEQLNLNIFNYDEAEMNRIIFGDELWTALCGAKEIFLKCFKQEMNITKPFSHAVLEILARGRLEYLDFVNRKHIYEMKMIMCSDLDFEILNM